MVHIVVDRLPRDEGLGLVAQTGVIERAPALRSLGPISTLHRALVLLSRPLEIDNQFSPAKGEGTCRGMGWR